MLNDGREPQTADSLQVLYGMPVSPSVVLSP